MRSTRHRRVLFSALQYGFFARASSENVKFAGTECYNRYFYIDIYILIFRFSAFKRWLACRTL